MKQGMRAQARWLIGALVMLMLLPATSGGSARAMAQVTEYAGEWEITVDVLNGELRATFIGRVWETTDGVEKNEKVDVLDISESCTVFGAPIFGQDDVTLDGVDDYISCQIPDLELFFAPLHPPFRQQCICQFEGPPYASADISPVYSTDPQPVVYHNRLHLDVMHVDTKTVRFPTIKTLAGGKTLAGDGKSNWLRDAVRMDANNSLGQARLTLNFVDGTSSSWQSNPFSIWQENGFQIWAGYNAARFAGKNSGDGFNAFLGESGFWEDVQPAYTTGLFFWESEAESLYSEEVMNPGFGLDSGTDIYIGHNPVTGTFFEGRVRAVAVDPGCRGH
jgi:hypothetical protein